jgi:hypothetical protein
MRPNDFSDARVLVAGGALIRALIRLDCGSFSGQ